MINVVTPSSVAAALPIATLRSHLRLDHTDEDATLQIYAAAAVRALERQTGRSFGLSTFAVTLAMPSSQLLMIQLADVASVTSLVITTPNGSQVTVAAGDIVLRAHAYGCLIMPAASAVWPEAANTDDAVTVTLTAGLDPIPSDLTAALLLTASRFFADREDATIPSAALNLCSPFRTGGWL